MFSGVSGQHRTAMELRFPAGGQVKMKGGKNKRKLMLRRSTVGFCFGFSFPEMCVCGTIAQMILLEEYKLLVFIAYSCFTALLE